MSVPNFSSLAGLEVAEKFEVVGGVVEHLTTVSNSNASCFKVALSCFELRWVWQLNQSFLISCYYLSFEPSIFQI